MDNKEYLENEEKIQNQKICAGTSREIEKGGKPDSFQAIDERIGGIEKLVESAEKVKPIEFAAQDLAVAQWNISQNLPIGRQSLRQFTMFLASVATLTYLTYRIIWTLNMANPFAIAFSITLLAVEMFGAFHLFLYFFSGMENRGTTARQTDRRKNRRRIRHHIQ